MADLKTQIEISADSSGVESGVGKAKRSLADLGATSTATSKRASDSIDRYVKKLETQAATQGKTTREVKLYELAMRGASRAQLDAADSALRLHERYQRSEELSKTLRRGLIATSTAVVAAAAAAAAMLRNQINAVDALNDLRDATGSTIENISALEDIALRAGGSFAGLSTTMIRFTQVLKDAEKGSVIAGIINQIGLDAEELKRIDPADALHQTAKALARFSNDGAKARVVQELFGRSVAEVAPLLNDLAEKTELVGTVTAKQAEEAEKFNKQLAQLSKNTIDAARDLAGPLVASLNETIEKFRQGAKEGKNFYQVIREEQLRMLGLAGAAPGQQRQSGVISQMMGIDDLRRSEIAGRGVGSVGAIPVAEKTTTKAAAKLRALDSAEFVGPEVPSAVSAALRRLDGTDIAHVAALREELNQLLSIQAAGGNQRVSEAIGRVRDELARLDPVTQAAAKSKSRVDELLSATSGAQIAKQRADMQLLADALEGRIEGVKITAEEFSEAASVALGNIAPAAKDATDKIDQFSIQAARNIQDSLGDTLKRTMDGDFKSIGAMWGDLIKNMIAQAAGAKLNTWLFGADFGTKGAIGGVIGGLLPKGFGGLFADGGTLGAGKWGIAGERGPEIIKGPAHIVPLTGSRAAVGGSQTVNVVNHIGAGVSRNEVQSLMQLYGAQIKGEILGSMRNGGAFA